MSKSRAHRVRDSLIADAAEAQRKNGQLPDTRADEDFWRSELEEFDQRATEAQRRGIGQAKRVQGGRAEPSEKAREMLAERGAEVADADALARAAKRREAQRKRVETQAAAERVEAFLLGCRLRLLNQYPEWRDRVIAAYNEGARKAFLAEGAEAQHTKLLQGREIRKIIEQSCLTFGDWRQMRGFKLMGLPAGKVEAKNIVTP